MLAAGYDNLMEYGGDIAHIRDLVEYGELTDALRGVTGDLVLAMREFRANRTGEGATAFRSALVEANASLLPLLVSDPVFANILRFGSALRNNPESLNGLREGSDEASIVDGLSDLADSLHNVETSLTEFFFGADDYEEPLDEEELATLFSAPSPGPLDDSVSEVMEWVAELFGTATELLEEVSEAIATGDFENELMDAVAEELEELAEEGPWDEATVEDTILDVIDTVFDILDAIFGNDVDAE